MPDSSTQVVLLGTGTPNPDPERMGPSLAIVVNQQAYIVDFGPGLVRRAQAAYQQGIAALQVKCLDIAFLTHLHTDHTLGFADLVFTPWVMGREKPLRVFGPPGVKSMSEHILAAYSEDQKVRVCGFEPINTSGYGVIAEEIQPGVCYQDDNVKVEAYAVNHGEGWLALSYKFTSADRCIVISGDTAPHPPLLEQWRGCDLLVHEVYSAAGFAKRSADWQKYHSHMHTSSTELAAIATTVKPKCLLLTHLLLWGVSEQQLLAEITADYDGEVICGTDLGVY